jgi:competence protein ComEC
VFLSFAGVCSILAVLTFARRRQTTAALLLAPAFLCLGAALALVEKTSIAADRVRKFYDDEQIASGEPVEVTGLLKRQPEPASDGFYLSLNVQKLRVKDVERNATGVVSLFASSRDRTVQAEYEALELRYGARINVMTSLSRMDNFRNPGVSMFTEYLDQRGIDATGVIKSPLLIERLDDDRVFLPLAWLYEWRTRLLTLFQQRFSPETSGVLQAVLLGNRYQLSKGAAERFREGGTFHVLVISGLHVSFIGLVVLLFMRRVTRRREWQFGVSVVVLWSYTLAVGAESSVVRAALMFTLIALAPVVHRHANSLNALGGAGLALLVWRPSDLFDPSFQLTFLSVLAIVSVAWPILVRLQKIGAWRPTRESPAPPICSRWLRDLAEVLYWDEKDWQDEQKHSPWQCRLFKFPYAARLQSLHLQWFARYVFSAVVVTVSVQIVLLPLLVLYFHRISIASILLNIVTSVLMCLLTVSALVAVLISEISSTLGTPFVSLTEAINWLMIHSVDPFDALRIASIRLPEYSGWASLVYGLLYVPLVALTVKLARWNLHRHPSLIPKKKPRVSTRVAACALIGAVVIIVVHPFSARRPDGQLHIDFLDVGQGDAALVTMPDGTTILVDGGGKASFANSRPALSDDVEPMPFERDTRSIGEAVVSEYLWWRGLDHVDYIVATHADADHIDGLNAVARNFKVRCALVAREPSGDAEYMQFATTLRKSDVPLQLIGRGDTLQVGEVTLDVVWPSRANNADAPSRNDDSIVLRLRYGERVILLTGDIENRAENSLAGGIEELKSDVVKVAHHGSKTSSIERFVTATRPSIAVISVGLTSAYGHPNKDVVERWRTAGAKVLQTGRSGTITVTTNGRDLKIETYVAAPSEH